METPYGGRATINPTFDGLEIIIPAKRNLFVVAFLGFWLCGWLFGELFVLGAILSGGIPTGPGLFMLVWLGMWTVGGLFAISVFWWMIRGQEVITFGRGQLTIEKHGLLFSKPKTYDLNEVKKVRVQESMPYPACGRRTDFSGYANAGTIRFDYGLKTVQVANGIDEAEANYILEQLKVKRLLTDKNF